MKTLATIKLDGQEARVQLFWEGGSIYGRYENGDVENTETQCGLREALETIEYCWGGGNWELDFED